MTQHVLPYLITWAIKVSHCLGKNTKKINQDLTWKNTVDLAWTLSCLETSTLVWNPSLAPGRPAGPKKSFKIINSSSSSDKVEMKGAKDLELNSFPSKSASFLNKEAVSVLALIQRFFLLFLAAYGDWCRFPVPFKWKMLPAVATIQIRALESDGKIFVWIHQYISLFLLKALKFVFAKYIHKSSWFVLKG